MSRATLANGCLHVVPGTHLEPVHTHVPDARPNVTTSYFEIVDHDSSAEVAVEIEPGDVLFFDSHVMHASTDNATDELRAAYVCHYTAMGTKLLMDYALYHDQALCKEPGGGPTPWHQDQHYWLIVSPDTVTMWLALDDVPPEIGTMTFVPGTHRFANLVDLGISDKSEATYEAVITERGWERATFGAVAAGDATFHRRWTLHSAGANPTDRVRPAMTVIYVDAVAVVSEPINDAQRLDQAIWLDGRPAGAPVTGPRNPVLYPRR